MGVVFRLTGVEVRQDGEAPLYDEAMQLLLVPSPANTSLLLTFIDGPRQPPKEVRISEGPPVAAACLSLDGRFLALQRSPSNLQFIELATAKTFVQASHKGKAAVLGFFWTATPNCKFVMVNRTGVETYQVQGNGQGLALSQQLPHTVKWWRYSHEARVLLLGTGDAGIWLQAYQFASEGVLRMPPFQIGSSSGSGGGSGGAALAPDPSAVSILTLYARVYCAVLDRKERRLSLYRFYKDAVLLQHRFEVPSAATQLLVADDLLVAAHPRTGLASVLDTAADAAIGVGLPIQLPPAQDAGIDGEARMRRLQYRLPNVVLDPATQAVLRCHVDVEALVAGCADCAQRVGFVLRCSPALYSCDLPGMALALMKEALVERTDMESVRRMCDAVAAGQAVPRGQARAKVELTPQEVCARVFQWLHDEEAVDAQYLQAAIAEYQASAASFGVELPLMQQMLAFEVALQLGQQAQVAMELWAGHDKDGRPLAAQLQAWPGLAGGRQLADDMRRRTEDWEGLCRSLLEQGRTVEAVRQMQAHGLLHLLTLDLPARAAEEGGIAAFAAVHRLCLPVLPPEQRDFTAAAQALRLLGSAEA